MAVIFADLVRQFSTSVGVGPIALSSTPLGFKTFASACAAGDTFYYSIINLDKPAETETGLGTFVVPNSFTRAPTGAPTNFSAGKKQVSLTVSAGFFASLQALIAAGIFDPTTLETEIAAKADATATTAALAAKVDSAGLSELIDDRVAALLQPGSGITLTYDDVANQLTINDVDTGGGGGGGGPSTTGEPIGLLLSLTKAA